MLSLIKSTFYHEKETKKALQKFIAHASQLSFGDQCLLFEKKFAAWQKRKDCIVVNSGSSANVAIIQALLNLKKLKKGDAVGFSAVTWSTNVMPLIELGLVPVPIDVSLETLNVSPETLAGTLKKYPLKMVFLTNLLGLCDRIDEIAAILKKQNILLVEDNCESLGSVYQGKKLGNYGLASTCSFYVGHHLSTIEGGAIVTDNAQLATMLRLVRAHGWDRNLTFSGQEKIRKKFSINSSFYSRYVFYDLGYNFRPTEIMGFLGNSQMPYLNEIVANREKNFQRLAPLLYTHPAYYPLRWDHMERISSFAFPLICRDSRMRETIVKRCDGVVEIRPVVGGNMLSQPFYKKYFPQHSNACPNAQLIHEQGMYFGNNPELSRKDLQLYKKIFLL